MADSVFVIPAEAGIHACSWHPAPLLDARLRGHDVAEAVGFMGRSRLLLALSRRAVSEKIDSLGGDEMSAVKIVGIVLIAAGILGLVYGGFSYTKETHEAKIGSLELSVKDKETVNVPVWAGVGAIVIGGILLLVPTKK
jgi:hypothetical protein